MVLEAGAKNINSTQHAQVGVQRQGEPSAIIPAEVKPIAEAMLSAGSSESVLNLSHSTPTNFRRKSLLDSGARRTAHSGRCRSKSGKDLPVQGHPCPAAQREEE